MRPMMNSSPSEMKPRSPGSQPWLFGVPADACDKLPVQTSLSLSGFLPVADSDVVAVHPDFTGRSRRTLGAGLGIDDAHDR